MQAFFVGALGFQAQHAALGGQGLDAGHAQLGGFFDQPVHAFVGGHANRQMHGAVCFIGGSGERAHCHVHIMATHALDHCLKRAFGMARVWLAVEQGDAPARLQAQHLHMARSGVGQG